MTINSVITSIKATVNKWFLRSTYCMSTPYNLSWTLFLKCIKDHITDLIKSYELETVSLVPSAAILVCQFLEYKLQKLSTTYRTVVYLWIPTACDFTANSRLLHPKTLLWKQWERTDTVKLQTGHQNNELKLTVWLHKAEGSCRYGW